MTVAGLSTPTHTGRSAIAVAYGPRQLPDLLLQLQHRRASGLVCVDATAARGNCQRHLVFCEGRLVYAGKAIPGPQEFLTEISQYLQVGVVDAATELAAKRSSVQSLLTTLVKVGVLQWSEIIAAVRQQIVGVLQDLNNTTGRVAFRPGTTAFDLRYPPFNAGQPMGFAVDALLVEARHGERSATPETPSPRRATILSIDDSKSAQIVVKGILGSEYHVETCDSPLAALTILTQPNSIDLLLLDVMLPDINGLDFCNLIRKQFKTLPIVMLTGRAGTLDSIRGRMAGATRYLTKPVNPPELRAVVARELAAARVRG